MSTDEVIRYRCEACNRTVYVRNPASDSEPDCRLCNALLVRSHPVPNAATTRREGE